MKGGLTPRQKTSGRIPKPQSIYEPDSFKFQYIWPSSIPDSWNRIFSQKHISKLRITKNERNTLRFLQETQKYIEQIRKPMNPEDIRIMPSSYRSTERIPRPNQNNSISPKISKNSNINIRLKRLKKDKVTVHGKNIKIGYKTNINSPILSSRIFDSYETSPSVRGLLRSKFEKKSLSKLIDLSKSDNIYN